jgi:hypothetical protein
MTYIGRHRKPGKIYGPGECEPPATGYTGKHGETDEIADALALSRVESGACER